MFSYDSQPFDSHAVDEKRKYQNKVDELEARVETLEETITLLKSILKALVGDLTMHSNLPEHIRNTIQSQLMEE